MQVTVCIREEIELDACLIETMVEKGIDIENYREVVGFLKSNIEIDGNWLELDDISVEYVDLEELKEKVNEIFDDEEEENN